MGLLVRSFNSLLYRCFSGTSDVQGAGPGLTAPWETDPHSHRTHVAKVGAVGRQAVNIKQLK